MRDTPKANALKATVLSGFVAEELLRVIDEAEAPAARLTAQTTLREVEERRTDRASEAVEAFERQGLTSDERE
jgi:hypothetical protein